MTDLAQPPQIGAVDRPTVAPVRIVVKFAASRVSHTNSGTWTRAGSRVAW